MTTREYRYHTVKKILAIAKSQKQCPEFPHFGAKYPDARCIDGFLWDLDSCDDVDGQICLTSGGDDPCPFCNTRPFISCMIDNEVSITRIYNHIKFLANRYGKLN